MCVCVCVCVNAIHTILQFILVTHGHLFRVRLGATKGTDIPIITHNILIIIVLLCRCSPYMWKACDRLVWILWALLAPKTDVCSSEPV